ncbi:hypothetical protein A3A46_03525 [Candidatus Roizmanbacteria bacterium RIFCSPLOWO2_01_FULL_37_13]|nr:MAG: hypothetical protein A3A46_03525 [Candidatus Roizmanbacteria bacterium RIFCSPLOWO2_01_FULL_37_13]
MKKIELSIVIVSYNTRTITKKCIASILKSLINTNISYEVIVIDNGSSDGSLEYLKKLYSNYSNTRLPSLGLGLSGQVRIIGVKTNLGFGKGNNLGVKHSRGKCILFLNSDVIVLNNAIEKLFAYFKKQKSFNFIGGKLLNKDLTHQGSCGPTFSLIVIFIALFLKGDFFKITRYSPNKISKVDWISGACILCQKKDFKSLGGFDEKIFMYLEETELFHRAVKSGFRVGFYPHAEFIHLGGINSQILKSKVLLNIYKGFIYFYKKHRSKTELHILKFLLKLRALISIFIGLASHNKDLVAANKKAYKIVSS